MKNKYSVTVFCYRQSNKEKQKQTVVDVLGFTPMEKFDLELPVLGTCMHLIFTHFLKQKHSILPVLVASSQTYPTTELRQTVECTEPGCSTPKQAEECGNDKAILIDYLQTKKTLVEGH